MTLQHRTLHQTSQRRTLRRRKHKLSALRSMSLFLLTVLLFISASMGIALAYMKWSGGIKNEFTAEHTIDPDIEETFTNHEKTNVSVKAGETGYAVYVRAAVVITWMDEEGKVFSQSPQRGVDYEIEWNLEDGGWFYGNDGFYYYASRVESGEATGVLIKSCKPLAGAPEEGYALDVRIAAQTIQAAGATDAGDIPAVTDAWGVVVNENGTIAAGN